MFSFNFYGHKNILGTHKNTLEFTKDSELTKEGDCIIGVKADFKPLDLKKFLSFRKIKMILEVDDISEEITAIPNKEFADNHEIVIRKSEFPSKRTFGIRCDKAAIDLDRRLIERLKTPGKKGVLKIAGIR